MSQILDLKTKSRRSIGKAIQFIRKQKGITQETLAEKTKFTVNFLSRLECGTKGASHDTVVKIAKALKVPFSFIYILADNSQHPILFEAENRICLEYL